MMAFMEDRSPLNKPIPGAAQFSFHFEEYGQGDAICMLLHGFGEGGYVWYDFVARLPDSHRAVIVDFRGHGNSGNDPEQQYDIHTYSADVAKLANEYKSKNITLIGHSLGAAVALKVAASAPDLVSDLVLVDLSLTTKLTVLSDIITQFHEQCDGYDSRSEYAAWISERRPLVHPSALNFIVEHAVRKTESGRFTLKADRNIQKLLTASDDKLTNVRKSLEAIKCRTLVMRGIGSASLSKKEAFSIANSLQNGLFCEISGAGHAVMTDNPDKFAEETINFLLGSRTLVGES